MQMLKSLARRLGLGNMKAPSTALHEVSLARG